MKAEEAIQELAYKHAEAKVTRDSYGEPDISPDKDKIEALISDLTALISEHYYPKEFVTWLSFGPHPFVYWFDEEGQYYTDEITDKRWNIEDLYNHWKENER